VLLGLATRDKTLAKRERDRYEKALDGAFRAVLGPPESNASSTERAVLFVQRVELTAEALRWRVSKEDRKRIAKRETTVASVLEKYLDHVVPMVEVPYTQMYPVQGEFPRVATREAIRACLQKWGGRGRTGGKWQVLAAALKQLGCPFSPESLAASVRKKKRRKLANPQVR
jgi:hypothetical protein